MNFSWVKEDYPSCCPVYFELAYLNLFAKQSRGQLRLLRIDSHQGVAWLPLECREISEGKWEASSAYGYGGLWSVMPFPVSLNEWGKLMDFLASEHIICVFIRHTPFLNNHLLWPLEKRRANRKTYARTLPTELTLDRFCANSDQKLRWSIHAAQRHKLIVEFHPGSTWNNNDISAFYLMYLHLMQDKSTSSFYEFSEQFFWDHANAFGDQCELGLVRLPQSNQIIAGALFLLDKKNQDSWVHYHLSASKRQATSCQSVELLLAEAIVRYANHGYHHLHLGGGHTLAESDGLSKFKKKFSSNTLDYEISTWICDEQAYQLERNRIPLKHPSHFLIHDSRGTL